MTIDRERGWGMPLDLKEYPSIQFDTVDDFLGACELKVATGPPGSVKDGDVSDSAVEEWARDWLTLAANYRAKVDREWSGHQAARDSRSRLAKLGVRIMTMEASREKDQRKRLGERIENLSRKLSK
jgi:hypothetical protein